MGKYLKRDIVQELEEINRKIQEEKSELRRRLQYSEDEKQELQERLLSQGEFLMGIIQ
jgi:hypothetical protein